MGLKKPIAQIFAGVASLLSASQITMAQTGQPNFLIISVDDLKSVMGSLSEEPGSFLQTVYSNPVTRSNIRQILTPNIDQLAQQSVVFSDAHTIYPICNPSRIALWTGSRPIDTGFVTNSFANFRTHPNGVNLVTLQQNLRDHGYFTTGLGKVFHSPRGSTDNTYSWDSWINRAHGAKGPWVHSQYSKNSFQFQFGASPYALDEQWDIQNADHAARLLSTGTSSINAFNSTDQVTVTLPVGNPFLLSLGIYLPHAPFVAPPEILDLFEAEDMDLTREELDDIYADLNDLSTGGQFYSTTNASGTSFAGYFTQLMNYGNQVSGQDGDLAAWKEMVRHYLASVAVADRAVGRVVNALDSGPYKDDTIIALHSDHGFHLGEKNVLGKNTLWNDATRSVLMIRTPSGSAALVDETVSLQDLYPTINALAGIPTPDYVPYQDLTPLMVDPLSSSTRPVLSTQGPVNAERVAVITERFLYTRFGGNLNNTELYDRFADPELSVNLVNQPAYQSLKLAMNTLLDQLLANVDAPPVIQPTDVQTGFVDTPVYQPVNAWHVLGDSLIYSASDLPPGVTISASSGLFEGTPTIAGLYDTTVTVSSANFSDSGIVQWQINNPLVPDIEPPEWQPDSSLEISEINDSSFNVSWLEAIDNTAVSSYDVTINGVLIATTGNTSLFVSSLMSDSEYQIAVFANDLQGNTSPALLATVQTDSAPPLLAISTLGATSIPGTEGIADDAHIYSVGNGKISILFDAAQTSLTSGADIDALAIISEDRFLASFNATTSIPGIGLITDRDIVKYDSGSWSMFQSGAGMGLVSGAHDIDALSYSEGILYFSIVGAVNLANLGLVDDADVLSWDGTSLSLVWDASEHGMIPGVDIVGLDVQTPDHFYITLDNNAVIPNLGQVADEDILEFDGGSWSLFFDGSTFGLTSNGHDLDALAMGHDQLPQPDIEAPTWTAITTTVTELTDKSASLDWEDAIDNQAVAGYVVAYSHNGNTTIADVPGSEITLDGLLPDSAYLVEINAYDTQGNTSMDSLAASFTTNEAVKPPVNNNILFSILGNSAIPGVVAPADDGDIYMWDATQFSTVFDATLNGLVGGADIDALSVLGEQHFLISFLANTSITGLGAVRDEDVFEYNNGLWSMYFDATAQGMNSGGHDIDGLSIFDGVMYFSTVGAVAIPGLIQPDDADIYAWDGSSFSLAFDASAAGLSSAADVDAVSKLGESHYLFSFNNTSTPIPALGNVQDEDIVQYLDGVWSIYFDGTTNTLTSGGHDIDALSTTF